MPRRPFLAALCVAHLLCGSQVFAQTDVVRIDAPQVDGVLLDWCRISGGKCGQPAADAFCRANGYRRSVRFVQWVDPGKPTKVISDGAVCNSSICDSFRWIECKTKR